MGIMWSMDLCCSVRILDDQEPSKRAGKLVGIGFSVALEMASTKKSLKSPLWGTKGGSEIGAATRLHAKRSRTQMVDSGALIPNNPW